MTREKLDSASFDGSINNGNSKTFEVNTSRAEDLTVLLDDGTTDNTPSQYTLTQRVYSSEHSDYQFYDRVTSSTSRSFTDPAWGDKMQIEVENTSGSSDTYRITIVSYRTLD